MGVTTESGDVPKVTLVEQWIESAATLAVFFLVPVAATPINGVILHTYVNMGIRSMMSLSVERTMPPVGVVVRHLCERVG